MEESDHLPLYGPGPAYVVTIAVLTLAGIALTLAGAIPVAGFGVAAMPVRVVGVLSVGGGVALWVAAVFGAKIVDGIESNRLVTGGVYGVVRNPIYTAFTFVCAGAILICGNAWLLVLLSAFWAILTVLMKATEEKWLLDRFGQDYVDYCARVNRCIPWIPRR